jgi:hypothetical protein
MKTVFRFVADRYPGRGITGEVEMLGSVNPGECFFALYWK